MNHGTLLVYSSGHCYSIEGVSEEAALAVIESFHEYHLHDGELDYEDFYDDTDSDVEYYLVLPYGKIDALAFEKSAA